MSCSSATACTAVGDYTNSAGGLSPLAERWNGTSWTIQTTPNPGATESHLQGVSCASATACTAVGYYFIGSDQVMLVERWNGTSWTIQSAPNPTGATYPQLQGVSCASATACTAVGYYDNASYDQVTLVERWNGTSWAIQSTPNPTGATSSHLQGVSCTSATACTAVGDYRNSSYEDLVLAERWNGTSWTIQSTPNPTGATSSQLQGVSCTSTTACTAVGDYDNSSYEQLKLAERWNGTNWTIQSTPNPTGATSSQLQGVSCTSTTACTAVGDYDNSSGHIVTLAERWNGTSWTIQTTPNPSAANGVLSGVSCTAATVCTAVGSSTNSAGTGVTLAERWNATSWAIQSTPNPTGATSSHLQGVSCTAASACTAVGSYTNSAGTGVTLAERWNGTSWAIQTTPNPSGAKSSELWGVSCTAASACSAVGDYQNSTGTRVTLAERWNGTSWTIQTTPNPSGAKSTELEGVSCTTASACTAVGYYENSAGTFVTLAERWTGTSWAIQTTPNPSGAKSSALSGVSCTTASACTAVGSYTNSAGTGVTLAERWTGTSWAIQTTPNPSGAKSSALSGVSCTTASACTAAGSYTNSAGTEVTLAERWNATSWTIQTTPNPSGTQGSDLSGVSCTSATACTTVGDNAVSYENQTLAERWTGTSWTIQTTPNPTGNLGAGSVDSDLSGVSCPSTTACTAVGDYLGPAGVFIPLGEGYSG